MSGDDSGLLPGGLTSATIRMVADRYAEAFAGAGVSALLYDHRNLGMSGGEPRQEINPWIQCRGYADAVTFASTLDQHDPSRIGVWGDSYSGGERSSWRQPAIHVCRLLLLSVPYSAQKSPAWHTEAKMFEEIRDIFLVGDVSGLPEDITGPIPVVSSDQMGTPSLLEPIQAFRWFTDYGGRHGSGWLNRATRILPSNTAPYSPYLCVPHVKVASLTMTAAKDEMTHANPAVSRAAFDLLGGDKEWYEIDGGHLGLLHHPSDLFDEASSVQADFPTRTLLEQTR